MKNLFTLLLLLFMAASLSFAQAPLQFRLRHDVPLTMGAGALPMPWSGGLSTPQFSTIDLNKDGQEDLFVFDRMQRKVFTYLAVRHNGQWRYEYAPAYEAFFPDDLENWVLLRDYNCDGLKDIFTSSPLGIRVFKQEQAAAGEVKFTLSENTVFYRGNVNMQMNSADIPDIVDMDGDGDLDILLTEFSRGYTLEYYRNFQVEQGLGCGTLKFEKETNWWGGIFECENAACNTFLFHTTCRLAAPLHTGHDGSSLLTVDLNGNGVRDLLIGSVQCDNLVKMVNKGTKTEARMDSYEPIFPLTTKPVRLNLFPAAYYEDVTFDGVPDMLVAPNSNLNEANVELQRSVWLYRNKGAANNPDFEFVQDDFLQQQMLDLGEGAYPAFADIDGDGKLDMLVGNYASFRGGVYTSSLSYFRNTGTAGAPAFTLVTDDYLGLAAAEYIAIKPVFADMNGNGSLDLVLTLTARQSNTTQISYLLNTGQPNEAFRLVATDMQPLMAVANGDSPAFVDADNDGDLDLLIGKTNGRLEFHRNTGSLLAPVFVLEKENLGGIDFNFIHRNLYPTVADMNGNGTPDLLTVDDSGELRIYTDFTKNLSGLFEAKTELLQNELTQAVHVTKFGKGLSIAVAPFGAAGELFVAVGTQGGGLYLLEQTSGNSQNPRVPNEGLALELYPNPTDRSDPETVRAQAAEAVALEVYDAVGRKVYSTGSNFNRFHSLPLQNLKAGVYIVRATSQSGLQESKKIVVR